MIKALTTLVLIFTAIPFCNAQLSGKVVAIADGDTFTLLTENRQQIKIRLFGIDCPEKGQDFGKAAKDYLSDLVFFDTVQVATRGLDDYGRTLGIVTRFGVNVNERMLQRGLAWHFTKYDSNPAWQQYENKARQLKKGLWASSAIAPWEWRKTHNN